MAVTRNNLSTTATSLQQGTGLAARKAALSAAMGKSVMARQMPVPNKPQIAQQLLSMDDNPTARTSTQIGTGRVAAPAFQAGVTGENGAPVYATRELSADPNAVNANASLTQNQAYNDLPFKEGLNDTQKSGITNLFNSGRTFNETDAKNVAYALGISDPSTLVGKTGADYMKGMTDPGGVMKAVTGQVVNNFDAGVLNESNTNGSLTFGDVGGGTDFNAFMSSLDKMWQMTQSSEQSKLEQQQGDMMDSLKTDYGKLGTMGDYARQQEESLGINADTTKLKEINTQIAQKIGEYQQAQQNISQQPIPQGLLVGQSAALQRQAAIDVGVLQGQAEALRGNLELSYNMLDRAIAMEFEPVKQQIEATKFFLEQNQSQMTKEESKQAFKINQILALREQAVNQAIADKENVKNLMLSVAQAGGDPTMLDFNKSFQDNVAAVAPFLRKKELESLALQAAQAGAGEDVIGRILGSKSVGAAAQELARASLGKGEDRFLTLEEAGSLGVPFGTKMSEVIDDQIVPTGDNEDRPLTISEATELGVPIGTWLSDVEGTVPTAPEDELKPPTDAEFKNAGFYKTMNQVESSLDFNPWYSDTGLIGQYIPNVLKSEERQTFENGARAFVNAALRRESGATITDSEFLNKYKELIPMKNDTEGVLKQKAQLRKGVMDSMRQSSGTAVDSDSGSDDDPMGLFKTDLSKSLNGSIKTGTIGNKEVSVNKKISKRLAMAQAEFKRLTGKDLQINQSHRTHKEQARLYKELSAKGARVAPPGKSFHEKGLAIDVTNWKEAEPILRKYGFKNNLADDKGHFSIGEFT